MITQMLIAGGGYLPESKAYFDAMAVQLDEARKGIINKCIRSIISGGAWPYLGMLTIHALPEEQQSLLNVINPTSLVTNLQKFGSPVWTPNVGWTGTGANGNRLSTLGNLTDPEFKFTTNDAWFGSYVVNGGTAGNRSIMGQNSNRLELMPNVVAGSIGGHINSTASPSGGAGNLPNLIHGIRTDPTDARFYSSDNLQFTNNAMGTVAPSATPMHILTNNNSYAGNAQTSLSFIGSAPPDAVKTNFVNAVNTLIAELAAL